MVGRIETYTHSDSITPNKGAAVVKVECDTDFAARTDAFKAFSAKVAKFAYGASMTVHGTPTISWSDVVAVFPDIEIEREVLGKTLREKIEVTEIAIMTLQPRILSTHVKTD